MALFLSIPAICLNFSLLPQALPVNFTFETNVDFLINAPFQAHTYKHTHRATENKEYGLVTASGNERGEKRESTKAKKQPDVASGQNKTTTVIFSLFLSLALR